MNPEEHTVSVAVPPYIHPQALVETPHIGSGTRIWAFAHLRPGVRVGCGCNIGDHCFLEDEVEIGHGVTIKNGVSIWRGVRIADDVFVGPNAVFTNDLSPRAFLRRESEALLPTGIGRGATIGANSTILCGHEVGPFALIAAGAVLTHDAPGHSLMAGCPARCVGWVCRCGKRLQPRPPRAFCCTVCRLHYCQHAGALRLCSHPEADTAGKAFTLRQ